MKVKIFESKVEAYAFKELENRVNEWFMGNEVELFDIKQSAVYDNTERMSYLTITIFYRQAE